MDYTSHIHRLFRLIVQIQGSPNLNPKRLAELCDLTVRTIQRDIAILKECGIPLSFTTKKTGGYAIRRDFFLQPVDLTLQEAMAVLMLADRVGGSTSQIPHLAQAGKAAEKLLAILPLVVDSPSAETGATSYNIYGSTAPDGSTAPGLETLLNQTPVAIGTNWTELETGVSQLGIPLPADIGDSNLTQVTDHVGGSAPDRVTQNLYDFQDRQVASKTGVLLSSGLPDPAGETDGAGARSITYSVLDNQGEVVQSLQYAGDGIPLSDFVASALTDGTPSVDSGDLRAKTENIYDDQGRVDQTKVFSVDPETPERHRAITWPPIPFTIIAVMHWRSTRLPRARPNILMMASVQKSSRNRRPTAA